MRVGAIALYEEALHEQAPALVMRTSDGRGLPLQIPRWCEPPDAVDEALLQCCRGPVLDVGCGPGRLTIALAERGVEALGVDISQAAVDRVLQAGAPALNRSVFDPLPGQGRWATVLLADGNIGIGGMPARLLRRCAELLAPGGQILIEAEPGDIDERVTAWLEHSDGRRGPVFPWARLGTAAVLRAAAAVGLHVVHQWHDGDRAFVCATTQPATVPEVGDDGRMVAPAPAGLILLVVGAIRTPLDRDIVAARLAGFPRLAVHRPELKQAAVAVCVTVSDGLPCLLITRRASRLRSHAGQWALPGGRREAGEAAADGALRELAEEVGLALGPDAVLGILDDYPTRSGYVITPVVCWAGPTGTLTGSEAEVASVHQVPLTDFDVEPRLVSIPESDAPVIQLPLLGGYLHAPTAAIVYQFCRIACRGEVHRVAHYEQPVWAWR